MTERPNNAYCNLTNIVFTANNGPILSSNVGKFIKTTVFYHKNKCMKITHPCAQERFQLDPCLKTYSAPHVQTVRF